ncbi:MAG: hypothetical protein ACOC83_05885 [Gemmatimonadota bacterium]
MGTFLSRLRPSFEGPVGIAVDGVRPLHGVVGLALLLGLCGGPPPPSTTLAPVPDRARLYYDDSGGVTDSLRLVVREQEAFEDLWSRATSLRSDPPSRPEVDFEERMVVAAAAGRTEPGDRIRVDSVGVRERRTAEGDTEEVLAVVVRTVRECGGFQGEAYPVEILHVQRFDGPVEFLERQERGSGCQAASRVSSSPSGSPDPAGAGGGAGDGRR